MSRALLGVFSLIVLVSIYLLARAVFDANKSSGDTVEAIRVSLASTPSVIKEIECRSTACRVAKARQGIENRRPTSASSSAKTPH